MDIDSKLLDELAKILDEKLKPIHESLDNLKDKVSKLDSIERSLSTLSDQYVELEKKVSNLKKLNKERQTEIGNLSMTVNLLSNQLSVLKSEQNNQNQYGRRDTLEISGIPVCIGENTNDIVCKVGKALDVEIHDKDISVSHRLPVDKSKQQTPAIIVKFIKRDLRDTLYKARKGLRMKSTHDIGILRHPPSNIYISESLTPQNRQLFKKCLKAKKDLKLKFIWTRYGNIHLRKDGYSPVVNITNENDLHRLYRNNQGTYDDDDDNYG